MAWTDEQPDFSLEDLSLEVTPLSREDVLQRPSVKSWFDEHTLPDGRLDLRCPCDDDECR